MLKPIQYRRFKVWQTYKGAKTAEITTDTAFSAAESYATQYCKGRDFTVHFVDNHDSTTRKYYNYELGTIFVTEALQ